MLKIFNNRIKLNSEKFVADFKLSKFLEQSIPVLIGIYVFFNPFPHTTAIKEICYYLSVFFTIILISSKKINFDFKSPLVLPFGLFVCWAFIGLFFAIDKRNSIHDFYSHLLRYIILYFIIINYFKSYKLLSRLSWIIIISTTIFSLGSIIYFYFILGYGLSARLGVSALPQTGFNIICILALFAITLSFRELFTENYLLHRLTILLFCILTLFATFLLTQSQAAHVAIIFAGIPLFFNNKKYLIAFIVIILIVFTFSPFKDRLLGRITNDPRIPIMYVAAEVVKEYPVFGIGFGLQTYGKLDLEKYQKRIPQKYQEKGGTVADPHNMVMDVAVRLGLVGLVLFCYIIIVFFKMCWDIVKYGKDDSIKNWGWCLAASFIAVSVIGSFQPIFSHMPEVVLCTIFSMLTIVCRLNNEQISKGDERRT